MTGARRAHRTVGVHAGRPPHRSLVPPERDVHTGRPVDLDRSDKHRQDDTSRTDPRSDPPGAHQRPRWLRSRTVTTVGAGVAVAAVVTTVFLVTGPGDPSAGGAPLPSMSVTTPTTAPSPSASAITSSAAGPTLSPSGGTTPVGATSRPSPTSTPATTSRSVASPKPAPAIEPAAVSYYAVTATYTRFVRPEGAEDLHPTVGDVEKYQYPCNQGICSFYIGPPGSTFAAGAPSFTGRFAPISPDTGPIPCDIVFSWNFLRQANGSYTGTIDYQPKQIEADYPGGHCTSFAATQQVVLVPIAS